MDAKILKLINEKFHSILRQSEASLKLFGSDPAFANRMPLISSASVPIEERNTIMSQWGSYIRKLGATRVSFPRNVAENAYVFDPATSWFNAGVRSELWRRDLYIKIPELWRRDLYIKIPRELAAKILVLGSLP